MRNLRVLSGEQKARFNEIGPELGRDRERTARNEPQQKPQQGDCGGAKSGLSSLAIDRIEERVQPTEAQFGALDRLSEAVNKAVDALQAACPTTIPLTPVGRLEVMQQRLEAMIEAAEYCPAGARGLLCVAQQRAEGEVQSSRPPDRAVEQLVTIGDH